MAQRSTFVESAGMGLASGFFVGRAPQTEEAGTVPFGARDLQSDFGEALVGPSLMGKAVFQHHDAVGAPVPDADEFGAGLDPPGKFKPAVRLGPVRPSGACGGRGISARHNFRCGVADDAWRARTLSEAADIAQSRRRCAILDPAAPRARLCARTTVADLRRIRRRLPNPFITTRSSMTGQRCNT